jgi:hypothetical protein
MVAHCGQSYLTPYSASKWALGQPSPRMWPTPLSPRRSQSSRLVSSSVPRSACASYDLSIPDDEVHREFGDPQSPQAISLANRPRRRDGAVAASIASIFSTGRHADGSRSFACEHDRATEFIRRSLPCAGARHGSRQTGMIFYAEFTFCASNSEPPG